MADLTVTSISRAGILDSVGVAAAAAGGDSLPLNNGRRFVYVKNGGGSPITVTIAWSAASVIDGVAPAARTVTVANGTNKFIGPFPTDLYNDANGKVQLTYSAVTTVTVGAFELA